VGRQRLVHWLCVSAASEALGYAIARAAPGTAAGRTAGHTTGRTTTGIGRLPAWNHSIHDDESVHLEAASEVMNPSVETRLVAKLCWLPNRSAQASLRSARSRAR
jgi:hypothetical protein